MIRFPPSATSRRPALALAVVMTAVLWGSGCQSATHDVGFSAVQSLVTERSQTITDEPMPAEATISSLLEGDLTLDRAIQIALMNNRDLRAEYQELGISKAEVIQAGLAANPILHSSTRFPNQGPDKTRLDLGLVENFLDLLVRPARKRLAETQFERTQLRVADAVLAHAADAEMAWLEAVAAAQLVDMRKLIRDSAEASYELALRLRQAGNASDLEVAREQGLYEGARVELARAEGRAVASRERLNRALGLWGSQIHWTSTRRLPELPGTEIALDHLEARAIDRRLDLEALGKTVEAKALALGIKKKWRYLLSANIGVDGEREGDTWFLGPTLDVQLPIFDRGQATLLRLRSELEQAEHRLEGLAIAIRSEVRELRDRLVLQHDLAKHYREVVIPLRERTVQLTQEQYNFMLVGAFDLILAKQQEYDAYQSYIEAVRDYHQTKAELKKALGGSLPDAYEPGGESP